MARWDRRDFAKGKIYCLSARRLLRAQATGPGGPRTSVQEKRSVAQTTSRSPILQEDHPKSGHLSEGTSKDDLVEKPRSPMGWEKGQSLSGHLSIKVCIP